MNFSELRKTLSKPSTKKMNERQYLKLLAKLDLKARATVGTWEAEDVISFLESQRCITLARFYRKQDAQKAKTA
jgi:hypothetical protein